MPICKPNINRELNYNHVCPIRNANCIVLIKKKLVYICNECGMAGKKSRKIKQFYHNWIRSVAMFSLLLEMLLSPSQSLSLSLSWIRPTFFRCVANFGFNFFLCHVLYVCGFSLISFDNIDNVFHPELNYRDVLWLEISFFSLSLHFLSRHIKQNQQQRGKNRERESGKNCVLRTQPANVNNTDAKPTNEHMYIVHANNKKNRRESNLCEDKMKVQ